ncbi:MAG: A24 family peptidase C-terminal domain-containing protein [Thermoplasmata archaeon]
MGRTGSSEVLFGVAAATVVIGLGYGAVSDWRTREVSDHLWLVLALVGSALAVAGAWGSGVLPTLLYLAMALLVLEHLLPWDVAVERIHPQLPGALEAIAYVGVLAWLTWVGLTYGVGASGLPIGVIAVYASVLLARTLFELGLLYGGADAKALMVTGLLVPVAATPLLPIPMAAQLPLAVFPFALTLLMNAAVLSILVPLGLGVRNLARGDFEFPRGFTGYRLDVRELPRHFVWLKDPTFARDRTDEEREVETTAEDVALRRRQRDQLLAKGVARVWVTPQLPFIILLAAGAVSGLLAGNLLYDVLSLL